MVYKLIWGIADVGVIREEIVEYRIRKVFDACLSQRIV